MTKELKSKLLKLGGYEQLFNGGELPDEKTIKEAHKLRREVYEQLKIERVVDELSILANARVLKFTHFQDPATVSFDTEAVMYDDETVSIHLLNFHGWCDISDPAPVIENDTGETNRYHQEKLPN